MSVAIQYSKYMGDLKLNEVYWEKLQSMENLLDFNFSPSMSRVQDDPVMMRAGKGITALRLSVE